MDLAAINNQISTNGGSPNKINGKRKGESVEHVIPTVTKRQKVEATEQSAIANALSGTSAVCNLAPQSSSSHSSVAHQSPRKRLQLPAANRTNFRDQQQHKANKQKFIYGNYSQYYGYRNRGKDFHDIRLDVFAQRPELFSGRDVLDIGCNSGLITMEVAKRFDVKSIVGLDIDRSLINQANKALVRQKKALPSHSEARQQQRYPFNVSFVHGNYVLRDDVLLELESARFDTILCLSITKWIQLNFGDAGLKQAFRRMFLQLRKGGKLILEAQPYDNYGRRKKMTESIYANYKAINFYPKQFEEYLLSVEVGFKSVELLGVPEHCVAGFKRPIQIFSKE